MKLSFADDRVLAVMAHPDDVELLCAGTLARARADGAVVGVCVMCAGDKGVAADASSSNLSEVRQSEFREAAGMLGAAPHWFGVPDGELADTVAVRRQLVEIFRQFRPTLVLAHDPADYHPDHRAAAALAEAASWFCASRGHVTKSPPIDRAPALWWCDTVEMLGFDPAFYVDVSEHVALKGRMLACHRSQLARAGDTDFSPLAELMRRQSAARGAQAGVPAAEAFRAHAAFKRARAW